MNSPPATNPSVIPSKESSHPSRDDSSITLEVPVADCRPLRYVPVEATQMAMAPRSYSNLPLEAYLMDKNDHERRLLRLSLSSQLSTPVKVDDTNHQEHDDYDEDEDEDEEFSEPGSATSSSEYNNNQDEETKTRASAPSPVNSKKPTAGRDSVLSDVQVPAGSLEARHLPLHRELEDAGLGGLRF
ncbi:hypothetical protein CP533_1278 [Ophiocordyceps camponoti-saundersi (nom. inval.)]|nr:hypothetical protein CP533_1278 [Ophiocordyceps camponoti-saundersi (nom. inval.)]